ncbi:MAG TPA: aminoacyl-tRNA hydrolase [Pseudomonadales bacterium]|nr:aminoacyl-tRNA hydrolase [Pseudomonadales bacterium]
MAAMRLIAGLGNPGPRYDGTPHNVGAEFVEALAARYRIALADEPRFKARLGRGAIHDHDVRLLIPKTFMNLSGQSVGAVATFYKITPPEILVVHDEMAFEPGVIRLKRGGGHNGHNGLRDIIEALGNDASFNRLRIGVGHPGDRDRVSGYLTGAKMRPDDREKVHAAMQLSDELIGLICAGELGKAMNKLHTAASEDD